ncbi:MAG: InlB B-repeat-containing protein [Paludibacteraceae bacterium]|nr:InlB B-repeat-containing protein [Paludibacteraceae bacterium]
MKNNIFLANRATCTPPYNSHVNLPVFGAAFSTAFNAAFNAVFADGEPTANRRREQPCIAHRQPSTIKRVSLPVSIGSISVVEASVTHLSEESYSSHSKGKSVRALCRRAAMLLFALFLGISNVWGEEYFLIEDGSINTTHFKGTNNKIATNQSSCGGESFAKNVYNGSSCSSLDNIIGSNSIGYDVKTTTTIVELYVFQNSKTLATLYVCEMEENETPTIIQTYKPTYSYSSSTYYGEKYSFKIDKSKNTSLYFYTSATSLRYAQIKITETGEPLKRAGEVGYSTNFTKNRFATTDGSLMVHEGLEITTYGNMNLNATGINIRNKSISFTTKSSLCLLNVTVRGLSKSYPMYINTTGLAEGNVFDGNIVEYPLTTNTKYYIVASNANTYIDEISFTSATPPTKWQLYSNISGEWSGTDMTVIDGVASITMDNLARAGVYKFKIRKSIDNGSTWTYYGATASDNWLYLNNHQDWDLITDNSQDINMTAAAAGSYTFTFDTEAIEKQLTVTYPDNSVMVTYSMNDKGNNQYDFTSIGGTVPTPNSPSHDGDAFLGWYDNQECSAGHEVTFPLTVNENMTIYAKWIAAWYYHDDWINSGAANVMAMAKDGIYWYYGVPKADGQRTFQVQRLNSWYGLSCNQPGAYGTNITNMNTSDNKWSSDFKSKIYENSNDYYIIVYPPHTGANDTDNPIICASTFLPTTDGYTIPAGITVYFDNSGRKWGTPHLRMGRSDHNLAWAMSKVQGTDNLWKFTTDNDHKYSNYHAIHIANNCGWTITNSIYKTKTGDGNAITEATAFMNASIGCDITITPGSDHNIGDDDQNNNCQFYSYTKSVGYPTHTVTIMAPDNGTIKIGYTDVNGTVHNNVTETTAGLAHTCLLTISATPVTGYKDPVIKVNGTLINPSNQYILTDDATITAEFTAQSYTIILDKNGGSSNGTASVMMDASTLSEITHVGEYQGFVLDGYYTQDMLIKVLNADGTFAATNIDGFITNGQWTKNNNCTLYAKWNERGTHTPGKYESTDGYNTPLTTYETRQYEVYRFVGASPYRLCTATEKLCDIPASATNEYDDWFTMKFVNSRTCAVYVAEWTGLGTLNQTNYALNIDKGKADYLELKIQGYDQISFNRYTNTGTMQVLINDVVVSPSESTTENSQDIYRYDLDVNTTYTVRLSSTYSSVALQGFSLRLPEDYLIPSTHIPGTYETIYDAGYSSRPNDGHQYEVYFGKHASSSCVNFMAGTEMNYDVFGNDVAQNIDGCASDGWIAINGYARASCNAPKEEWQVNENWYYQRFKNEYSNYIRLKVSGYDQFSFMFKNADASVTINGINQIVTRSGDEWMVSRHDLQPENTYIITITADAQKADLYLAAFSLRLPLEPIEVQANETISLTAPVDVLIIHQGGQVTGDVTVNERIEYIRPTVGKYSAINQWYTFSVPFAPTDVTIYDETDKKAYPIDAVWEKGSTLQAGYYYLKTLFAQTVAKDVVASWKYITSAKPEKDKPYIIYFSNEHGFGNYFETNTQVSFIAEVDKEPIIINNTATPQASENIDGFQLVANPTLHNIEVENVYKLNPATNQFELEENATIPPFECYIQATKSFTAANAIIRFIPEGSFIYTDWKGAGAAQSDKPCKFIENERLMIRYNGQLYDGTGTMLNRVK